MPIQVLLIQPPVEDFYSTDCRTQPIGLAYIAAAISQKYPEMEVIVYDALSTGKKRTIPWPPEFKYLEKYYGCNDTSPFKLFHQYHRFGKSPDEIRLDLKKFKPLLVGISALFTPYYRQSLETAKICKEIFPDVKIVMGGNHATVAPESLLTARSPDNKNVFLCDYVIPGEAELLMQELVAHLLASSGEGRPVSPLPPEILCKETFTAPARKFKDSGISNDAGNVIGLRNPDINTLSFPVFAPDDMARYTYNRQPMSFLVTSRGCPYRCSFCGIHSVSGKRYRRRNNDNILDEIIALVSRGVRHIDIEDDHFTAHKGETHRLLDKIIELDLPVTFSAMNGLVYWTLDKDLLVKMKRAGFSTLNLSLVSRDEKFYEISSRPNEADKFSDIVQTAVRLGYTITAYFIIGRPGQTIAEMAGNLKFLGSLPVLIGASPYYLSPGTPDYLQHKSKNSLKIKMASSGKDPFLSARLSAMDIETDDFNRDDIYTLFRLSRVFNFIKRGLDLGHGQNHLFFEPARRIFSEKNGMLKTNPSTRNFLFLQRFLMNF